MFINVEFAIETCGTGIVFFNTQGFRISTGNHACDSLEHTLNQTTLLVAKYARMTDTALVGGICVDA